MADILNTIVDYLIKQDQIFEDNIKYFLKYYDLPSYKPPFLVANLPTFIKLSVYSLTALLPLVVLKLVKKEDRRIFILFSLTLIIFGLSVFGVFLGFFQLLFI